MGRRCSEPWGSAIDALVEAAEYLVNQKADAEEKIPREKKAFQKNFKTKIMTQISRTNKPPNQL